MHRRDFVTLAGAGIFGAFAGCGGSEETPEQVNSPTQTPAEGNEPTAQNTESTPTDESETDQDEDDSTPTEDPHGEAEGVVGDLIEGNNMQLVVEDFERGVDLGEYVEPDSGNEFARVRVALKNTSSSEFVQVSNLLQTRIRDSEGYSYEQTFYAGDNPTFNDGQFAPGEVERGYINFELPTDASGLELVWDFRSGIFVGLERAIIDLESESSVHELTQNLQIEVYDVGDAVEYQSVTVTVNDMRTESSLGQFAEPDPGNEYVVVDISIRNETGDAERVSTGLQMMTKDGDGWSYQEDFSASAQLDRGFDETSPIADGETRRGEVVYEIENGLSPLYWVFEFSLWTEGNKTFWQLR